MDIREIIDGERKSENMDNETKETLKKVAEYSSKLLIKNIISGVLKGILVFLVVYLTLNIGQFQFAELTIVSLSL